MENKKVIILSLMIIIGMVTIPVLYKIYDKHNKELILAVENEFMYYAKNCYKEEKCQNKTIYLKDLYDYEYLDSLTNPISKKYYQEDSYVNLDTYEIKLIS